MSAHRLTLRTALLLTIPPFLWAGNAVVGRLMATLVPPITFNLLRWTVTFVLLLPVAGWVLGRTSPLWSHWRRMTLLGLLGIGSYNSLQYMALKTSMPLNVTLVGSSMPLFMLGLGRLFYELHPAVCRRAFRLPSRRNAQTLPPRRLRSRRQWHRGLLTSVTLV